MRRISAHCLKNITYTNSIYYEKIKTPYGLCADGVGIDSPEYFYLRPDQTGFNITEQTDDPPVFFRYPEIIFICDQAFDNHRSLCYYPLILSDIDPPDISRDTQYQCDPYDNSGYPPGHTTC